VRFNTDSHSKGHRAEFDSTQENLLMSAWWSCRRVCQERRVTDHSFAGKSGCSLKHFPMDCNTNTQ